MADGYGGWSTDQPSSSNQPSIIEPSTINHRPSTITISHQPSAMSGTPIDHWHALLQTEDAPALCASLAERMRSRRLHFGGRPLCPFLRPFFLDAAYEH